VGDSTTYQMANIGTAANPSLRGAIQTSVNGGTISGGELTGSGVTAQNWGAIAPGASTSNFTVTANTAGAITGQAIHIANNFGNVPEQTVSITGNAYALASPTITSSLNPQFNFGVVQVGQTVTDALTVSNVLVASSAAFQEGLNASFGTISNPQLTTNGGSITNLAANTSDSTSMSVSLTPTQTGAIGGTVQVNLASNGQGTSGLGITPLTAQNLAYTWSISGTTINQASPNITPTTVNFGNVRIGSAQAQAITVANQTTQSPQASLDAQIGTATMPLTAPTGDATTNNGTISQLLAGQSNNTAISVGLNTSTAGARSGAATITLQSDSTPNGCTSNCIVNLAGQSISVSGNVFRLATGSATTPVSLGSTRVNGTLSGNLSVTNTAATDGFSENLDATINATTPQVINPSGSVTGLGAGSSSNNLSVGLATGTAGHISGTATVQFQSDGTGIDGGAPVNNGSQIVTVNGDVYTPAIANVQTTSINFNMANPVIHVDDVIGSQSIGVMNGAAVTALNDVLTSTGSNITTSGAPFSGTGNLGTGLGAQQSSSAFTVNLSTATAGIFSGTANLSLASHDSALADLALPTSAISLSAQVNNFAQLAFALSTGQGGITGQTNTGATLNFGNVQQGSSLPLDILDFLNCPGCNPNFTDELTASITAESNALFTLSGTEGVTDLVGGGSQGGFDIQLASDNTTGFVSEILTFDMKDFLPSTSFSKDLGPFMLTLDANVVPSVVGSVPEPGTLVIFGSGLGVIFLLFRRRRVRG